MKIVLEDSVKDRNIFKNLCKPLIRNHSLLSHTFKGLKKNSKTMILNSLRVMCLEVEECGNNFCTFKTPNLRFHFEQVDKATEIEITEL